MHSKSLVVVLSLVVVGALAWLVMGGGGTPAVPIAPQSGNVATPAVAGTVVGERGELERPAASGAGVVDRTPVETATAPTAAAANTIRVRGRLVDPTGSPRAALEVGVHTWPAIGVGLAESSPTEPGGQSQWRATSGDDGVFTFELPSNRDGSLHLWHDDLVFAAEPAQVDGGKGNQDLGDLVVVRAGLLQGVVQDAAGRPVADVKVAADIGSLGIGARSMTTTGADGSFALGKLRAGEWSLRTASSRFLPATMEVTLAAEERRTDLVLTVSAGNAIAGQVVDDRGVGVPNFKVGSMRRETRGAMDIERFSSDEATSTDATGFFTLAGLRDGSATIRAFGPGHTATQAKDVQVGTGDLALRVDRLAVVEGVLLGSDGVPIADSKVSARRAPVPVSHHPDSASTEGPSLMLRIDDPTPFDIPGAQSETETETGADGSFRLESVPPGRVLVVARGQGHRPVQQDGVQVLPGQIVRGLRMVADTGATAEVTVVDEGGQPVVGALARARRVPDQGASHVRFGSHGVNVENVENVAIDDVESLPGGTETLATGRTDANGVAVLKGLPGGPARFEAGYADFSNAPVVDVTLPLVGTTPVRLVLPTPGFAEVRVVGLGGEPVAASRFLVARVGAHGPGATKRGVTGVDGSAKVGPLAPGQYSAVLRRDPTPERIGDAMFQFEDDEGMTIEASRQPFTVVAAEVAPVEIRRPLLTRLHGIVSGVDGPVPACVVELTINGEFALGGFGGGRNTVTDSQGAFSFDDVEAGRYTMRYGKSTQLVKAAASVDVAPNVAEQQKDLVLRTGVVQAQVVAANGGDAIQDAEVELERENEGGEPQRRTRMVFATITADGQGGDAMTMTVGMQCARTDAEGRVRIDDVPVGTYTVRVNHRGCASVEKPQQIVVEQRATDCGRIAMSLASGVRGTVVRADGGAVDKAVVWHRPVGTKAWSEPILTNGGAFEVESLPVGRHSLRAQHLGQGGSGIGPEVEVEVVAGQTAAVGLRLP